MKNKLTDSQIAKMSVNSAMHLLTMVSAYDKGRVFEILEETAELVKLTSPDVIFDRNLSLDVNFEKLGEIDCAGAGNYSTVVLRAAVMLEGWNKNAN